MKKTFILTQFGEPHPWTQQYIDNVQALEKDEWYWKIFTPNNFKSKGNVEIIPMTIDEFNNLVFKTCGINPEVNIENGIPTKSMSDYYVANGLIFKNWLQDSDFWGITNWDVVYGRLSKFIPDRVLEKCDIFSDDVATINGVFSLFRNIDKVNELFKQIPHWEEFFIRADIIGIDEYEMTKVANKVRFEYPKHYPIHSHDRLENHWPQPQLRLVDGRLYELLKDMDPPEWEHKRPYIGREIPYFHFIRTKQWPNIAS